jgi:hypothetical protein
MTEPDSKDVRRALAKALKNARRAARAKTAEDREYYGRLQRKWSGLAQSWRVIDKKEMYDNGAPLQNHI